MKTFISWAMRMVLAIGVLICLLLVLWTLIQRSSPLTNLFKKEVSSKLEVQLEELVKVERLYTGFSRVPLVKKKYGTLMLDQIKFWEYSKKVLTGVVYKELEVRIGYENLLKLVREHHESACSGDYSKLPEPVIIDTNPVDDRCHAKGLGQVDCDRIFPHPRVAAKNYMLRRGMWAPIVENSRKALGQFIGLLCTSRELRPS